MAIAANLSVALALNSARYRQGLDQARGRTQQFQRNVNTSLTTATAGFARLGAAALALGATLGVGRLLQTADELSTLAQQSRIGFEDFQRLTRAFELSGITAQQYSTAIRTLTQNLGDAATGTGEAVDTFRALGLSLEGLAAARPQDAIFEVFDAINRVPDATVRAAAAINIFGSRVGPRLTRAAEEGSDALRELAASFPEGSILSDADVLSVRAFNDAMVELRATATAVVTAITPFLNAIAGVATFVGNAVASIPGLGAILQGVFITLIGGRIINVLSRFIGSLRLVDQTVRRQLVGAFRGNFRTALQRTGADLRTGSILARQFSFRLNILGRSVQVLPAVFRVASLAVRGFRVALAAVGGPIGLLLFALTEIVIFISGRWSQVLNFFIRNINRVTSAINRWTGTSIALIPELQAAADVASNFSTAADELTNSGDALNLTLADLGTTATGTTDALDMYRESLQTLLDRTMPLAAATRQYMMDLALLNRAFDNNDITATELAESIQFLMEQLQSLGGADDNVLETIFGDLERLNEGFEDIGTTIQTSLRDNIVEAFRTGSVSARDFLNDITGSILTVAANRITNSIIGSVFGGAGGGGGFFGSLGSIFLANQGGVVPSTPGSRPGVDSVPALLTPGETVTPAGEIPGGVTVNFNVTGDVSRQTLQVIQSNSLEIAGIVEQQLADRGRFA